MDQIHPLVCIPSREAGPEPDGRKHDAGGSPRTERQDEEPMADLPKEIWTKPLTQKQWETACALIMHWAMYGGC